MVALEKQLEASQRFLGGVRALASYEDIQQKQLKGLLTALGKSKDLSTSQAAAFLEGIDSRLWSAGALETLQREVAARGRPRHAQRNRRASANAPRRQSEQDYESLEAKSHRGRLRASYGDAIFRILVDICMQLNSGKRRLP